MRALRIRNTPSKLGSGKAWPHGPPSRSALAVSQRDLLDAQLAVGLDGVRGAGEPRPARHLLVERARETIEVRRGST